MSGELKTVTVPALVQLTPERLAKAEADRAAVERLLTPAFRVKFAQAERKLLGGR